MSKIKDNSQIKKDRQQVLLSELNESLLQSVTIQLSKVQSIINGKALVGITADTIEWLIANGYIVGERNNGAYTFVSITALGERRLFELQYPRWYQIRQALIPITTLLLAATGAVASIIAAYAAIIPLLPK